MIVAADTSSLIAYLQNLEGPDIERLSEALDANDLRLPPPVLTELYAGAAADSRLAALLLKAIPIPVDDGFWRRAGENRALLLSKKLKARLADTLIAQCCIDADVPLITRDADYRHFARWCGLKMAL